MRRTWLLIAVMAAAVAAACGDDGHAPDARPIDAPADSAGSGSNVAMMEPSPPDHGLELMVMVASMVVVVAPVRARRRREDDAARRT
jgi:hypothetical protein